MIVNTFEWKLTIPCIITLFADPAHKVAQKTQAWEWPFVGQPLKKFPASKAEAHGKVVQRGQDG